MLKAKKEDEAPNTFERKEEDNHMNQLNIARQIFYVLL